MGRIKEKEKEKEKRKERQRKEQARRCYYLKAHWFISSNFQKADFVVHTFCLKQDYNIIY